MHWLLDAGIISFDASLGGLGAAPFAPGATGNVCTEDLVHMFERMGCKTGVDLADLLSVWRTGHALRCDLTSATIMAASSGYNMPAISYAACASASEAPSLGSSYAVQAATNRMHHSSCGMTFKM